MARQREQKERQDVSTHSGKREGSQTQAVQTTAGQGGGQSPQTGLARREQSSP